MAIGARCLYDKEYSDVWDVVTTGLPLHFCQSLQTCLTTGWNEAKKARRTNIRCDGSWSLTNMSYILTASMDQLAPRAPTSQC